MSEDKKERKHKYRCQFHQHFTYEFFVLTSFRQLFSSYMYVTCTWTKLQKRHLYEKHARIKLMKLTTGFPRCPQKPMKIIDGKNCLQQWSKHKIITSKTRGLRRNCFYVICFDITWLKAHLPFTFTALNYNYCIFKYFLRPKESRISLWKLIPKSKFNKMNRLN